MIPVTLIDASRDARLSRTALRILIVLHREATYHQHAPVKQEWIALILRRHKSEVSRSLRQLRDLGYLHRGPFDASVGAHTYRLDVPTGSPVVAADATSRVA